LKSTIQKSLVLALLATVALPFFTRGASAQDGKGGLVAVLDVAKVFKDNQQFSAKMASIKAEADGLKATIQQKQEAIKVEAQGLGGYEVGSPERNQMEATLEQKQTSLRTEARQAEANLLNREAQVYYETYEQMKSIVSSIATQNGISLVLRFDSNPIDANNRAEVIKGVNRSVIFHRRLDLTNMVIKQMNPANAQAQGQTQNR
jgi:Skp family chaperone for outer membrane proteins